MRGNNRVDKVVMQKIIEYCEKTEVLIQRFGATFENFNSDTAFQLSCSMCIVQIGELTKRLSDDFKVRHPKMPWRAIKAMRNIYVHDYENVNLNRAWENLTENIPELKTQLEQILAAEETNDAAKI